jgi:predicted regulator of Ras-like GTPase activity (Roadblock/LC7/MglB family)
MPMADEIRRWSEELARDPASLAFLLLGEALRQKGELETAQRVAVHGLKRHPHHADAHDLLARIYVDQGAIDRAVDEWEMALRMTPEHPGALKGMAFVSFQRQHFEEAEEYLRRASLGDAPDSGIRAALDAVHRNSTSIDAPEVDAAADADPQLAFARVLETEDRTALLLDGSGLVLAGAYLRPDGRDVAAEVGAQLSGISEEADRATRHLGIGEWTSIIFEAEAAVVAMAPAAEGGVLVVAASRSTPLGLLRRLLDRCADQARYWVGGRDALRPRGQPREERP